MKIAASILNADFARLGQQIAEAEAAGVDLFHLDVMDGHFVPNISFGPAVVAAVRRSTSLPLDVHLMIANPDRYLTDYVQAGADYLMVHVETCPDLAATVAEMRRLKVKPCVSLNPATPASSLQRILPQVDLVLLMTVNPGFGGQAFEESVLPKIVQVRRWLTEQGLGTELEVDGGINALTAPKAVESGASILAVGSAIFRHPEGIKAGVREIRRSIGQSQE